jgi:hypothetical protein
MEEDEETSDDSSDYYGSVGVIGWARQDIEEYLPL